MDYEQIQAPFQDNAVDNIGRQDGVIDILPRISMKISDQDMIKNLNDRIENSVTYWDDTQGYNLKYARAQSERMVIGKQIDISKLYRYQIPYVDNEVHVAIDTIISYVTAQSPRPEVYPAQSCAVLVRRGQNLHHHRYKLTSVYSYTRLLLAAASN